MSEVLRFCNKCGYSGPLQDHPGCSYYAYIIEAPPPCKCRCGYRCGGPGKCTLDPLACLQQPEGHFVVDCDHKWDGSMYESFDGSLMSVTCSHCSMPAVYHDMRVGP